MTAFRQGPARAVADVANGVLLATIDISVPPERVFGAVTSQDLTQWWGSTDTYRTTAWTGDVRVGGAWRSEGVGVDGQRFSVQGEFLVVDPPKKLVQTWRYDWDPQASVTTITWRFDAIEGGTRVTVRHEGFGEAHAACADHALGWERVLGWLSQNFEVRP
jgi:uncharacterized protein YndB with AHSA1/START domain